MEDSVAILERAIEEARASADAATLRWAMHDLGVALSFLGRRDEAVALLEDSFQRAREADDRNLLMRCYINLPAVRVGRGDPPEPLIAMIVEGLGLARRSAASQTIAWLASNLTEFMVDTGRLDEALAYMDEAVTAARAVGHAHLPSSLWHRSVLHRMRGEPEAAARDLAEAERLGEISEPQLAGVRPLSQAWARWPDDPRGALDTLATWLWEHATGLGPRPAVAHEVARMALRLGERVTLSRAVELHRASRVNTEAALFLAKDQWVDGLAAGDQHAVEHAAAMLEEIDYRTPAAEAWADAAFLAASARTPSDAERRAAGLCAEIGLHPLLGPCAGDALAPR